MFKKVLIVMVAVVIMIGCNKNGQDGQQEMPPPPVIVEKVTTENVRTKDSYVGKLDAAAQAAITARVSGFLEKILVKEGDFVKKGQVLFTIEKSQYQATVKQAEATLAQAKANANNSALQRERAKALLESDGISQSKYDDVVASDIASQASVASAQAALDTARLNLQYTEVASPIDGKVGLIAYNIGETVSASSGTIVQVIAPDPMYVLFSLSDRQLQELRSRYNDLMNDVSLEISFSSGIPYSEKGKINFIDNAVSSATDSIRIRGIISNPNGVLTSGQTVTVSITSNTEQAMVTVPQASVINDIGGKYVLIVDSEGKAQRQNVTVGALLGDGKQIITDGLKVDDTIIIDGVQKVQIGGVVTAMTKAEYDAMVQQQMQQQGK